MRRKAGTDKPTAERVVKDIHRKTRKHHSAEEKIRIVLLLWVWARGSPSATQCERRAQPLARVCSRPAHYVQGHCEETNRVHLL